MEWSAPFTFPERLVLDGIVHAAQLTPQTQYYTRCNQYFTPPFLDVYGQTADTIEASKHLRVTCLICIAGI